MIVSICVAAFAATSIITLLALLNIIRIGPTPEAHAKYLNTLFRFLIIQIVVSAVGAFGTYLSGVFSKHDVVIFNATSSVFTADNWADTKVNFQDAKVTIGQQLVLGEGIEIPETGNYHIQAEIRAVDEPKGGTENDKGSMLWLGLTDGTNSNDANWSQAPYKQWTTRASADWKKEFKKGDIVKMPFVGGVAGSDKGSKDQGSRKYIGILSIVSTP